MWFWIRSVCQESKRAGFPENQIPAPCKRNCKQEPGSSCNSFCAAREKREKRQGDGSRNGMDGPGNFPASGEGGSGAEAEAVPGSRKRSREKWWHADTDCGHMGSCQRPPVGAATAVPASFEADFSASLRPSLSSRNTCAPAFPAAPFFRYACFNCSTFSKIRGILLSGQRLRQPSMETATYFPAPSDPNPLPASHHDPPPPGRLRPSAAAVPSPRSCPGRLLRGNNGCFPLLAIL